MIFPVPSRVHQIARTAHGAGLRLISHMWLCDDCKPATRARTVAYLCDRARARLKSYQAAVDAATAIVSTYIPIGTEVRYEGLEHFIGMGQTLAVVGIPLATPWLVMVGTADGIPLAPVNVTDVEPLESASAHRDSALFRACAALASQVAGSLGMATAYTVERPTPHGLLVLYMADAMADGTVIHLHGSGRAHLESLRLLMGSLNSHTVDPEVIRSDLLELLAKVNAS